MRISKKSALHLPSMALALLAAGCAAGAPAPARRDDEPFVSRAARVPAYLPLERIRLLLKGVDHEEFACADRLLAMVERKEPTMSQRMYFRMSIEKVLDAGGLRDHASELRQRLALSWQFVEPQLPARVRTNLEALAELGWRPERENATLLLQMASMTGSRTDRASRRSASGDAAVGQISSDPGRQPWASTLDGLWEELQCGVWGGGNDLLLMSTGVLAFLVNQRGEPVHHGSHLWIRNESGQTVAYSVPVGDIFLRELPPGGEEMIAVLPSKRTTTEIALAIRSARVRSDGGRRR